MGKFSTGAPRKALGWGILRPWHASVLSHPAARRASSRHASPPSPTTSWIPARPVRSRRATRCRSCTSVARRSTFPRTWTSIPTPFTRRGARTSTASTRTARSRATPCPGSSSTGRRGGGARRTALVATCSVDDYDADVIRKHEKTRPDKEDDRVRHLLAQSAHAEPVFLTYRAADAIDGARRPGDRGGPGVRLRGAGRREAHSLDRAGGRRRVLRRRRSRRCRFSTSPTAITAARRPRARAPR